jgi:hypothetical protein
VNKSLKGALLSGLVMPGLGQIFLKRYGRGIIQMVAASACMAAIITEAVKRALAILANIDLEGGMMDVSTISDAVTQATTKSDSFLFNLLLLAMALCWIISIVDAYRIGRKEDLVDTIEAPHCERTGNACPPSA